MSRNVRYTVITPLPAGISRETVRNTLQNHTGMIDLNPLVQERFRLPKPPASATPEEFHCAWYQIVDKVSYLPGGMATGKVAYHACFHDLAVSNSNSSSLAGRSDHAERCVLTEAAL